MKNTVLFADEELLRLAPLLEELEESGLKVVRAANASEAVEKAREGRHSIGVVVMDIMMPTGTAAPPGLDPRRSGLWALAEIRKIRELAETPAIVLSGVSQRRMADELQELSIARYVPKPADLDEFLQLVDKCIERKQV